MPSKVVSPKNSQSLSKVFINLKGKEKIGTTTEGNGIFIYNYHYRYVMVNTSSKINLGAEIALQKNECNS